jgi:hypothetical protein
MLRFPSVGIEWSPLRSRTMSPCSRFAPKALVAPRKKRVCVGRAYGGKCSIADHRVQALTLRVHNADRGNPRVNEYQTSHGLWMKAAIVELHVGRPRLVTVAAALIDAAIAAKEIWLASSGLSSFTTSSSAGAIPRRCQRIGGRCCWPGAHERACDQIQSRQHVSREWSRRAPEAKPIGTKEIGHIWERVWVPLRPMFCQMIST